jgi:hypothetical protein
VGYAVRPSMRRPFAIEACDRARAALPVPFAALADRTPKRIRPAGGRPAGRPSICPGRGAYKQACLDCVSAGGGRQIPPRLLRNAFGCGRRDAEQEVGTRFSRSHPSRRCCGAATTNVSPPWPSAAVKRSAAEQLPLIARLGERPLTQLAGTPFGRGPGSGIDVLIAD